LILSVLLNKLKFNYSLLIDNFSNNFFFAKTAIINKFSGVFLNYVGIFKNANIGKKYFFKKFLIYRFKKNNLKLSLYRYKRLFKISYFYYYTSSKKYAPYLLLKNIKFDKFFILFLNIFRKTIGDGFFFIRGLFLFFFFDACFTDDEPLWEPIEWSLVQTWLLFIFIFAWIAENLITSRFGSFTGRDKRVWFAWHKTFWLIELWYALCYGATSMFVIVPFYYEITYTVSFVFSWWNWYNRVFFFKFISIFSIAILLSHFLQLNIRFFSWKKIFLLALIVNIFLAYLLYTQFIITFFGYFTDPLWYQKTRSIDYVQLSHEPNKWGWGPAKRDHFTYHKTSTVFWYKNDGPFAAAFLMINMFFFLTIFFLLFYWLTFLRRIYALKEVSFTFATFCASSLKQFFFFFFLFYATILISFIVCYWRFPIEFIWLIESNSWLMHFLEILFNYYKLFK